MTTDADIETLNDLSVQAKQMVLEKIIEIGRDNAINYSRNVLSLAEAYAWLANPNQPHGGQS